jgi:hypothetical protein
VSAEAGIRYVGPRHIIRDGNPTPVPFWDPDRAFLGTTVVLIGGGPSHAEIDLAALSGHRFIAINSSCRKVRPVATADDFLYFSDNGWAERFELLVRDWPGPVVTSNRNTKARLGDLVRRLDIAVLTRAIGVMSDHVWASSGHSAACLAAIMGARRIVLVGFEGQFIDGRSHGHDDYRVSDALVFTARFLPGWKGLAPAFERLGVELVNATPRSAIAEFPFVSLSEALKA